MAEQIKLNDIEQLIDRILNTCNRHLADENELLSKKVKNNDNFELERKGNE